MNFKPTNKVSLDMIINAVEMDEPAGFCMACGDEAHGVEPDARQYRCEACGKRAVYGAEELLIICG